MAAAMVMGGLLVGASSPVAAQNLSEQPFTAFGTGTAVGVQALQLGTTQIAGVQAAFSGGSVASGGLGGPIANQFGQNVQPPEPGKNAYGRGAGLEVGAATPVPQGVDLNQLILSGRAEQTAPPIAPAAVTREIPLQVNPVLNANTLRGQARAIFDPVYCPVGRPLTFGLGYAENLQLLNTGAAPAPATGFPAPVVGTSTTAGNPRAASQSRTVTYLKSNGDGTYGIVSETRQTIAPVNLVGTALGAAISIELAGEFVMRVTATGKPGGATVDYPGTPIVTVKLAGVNVAPPVSLQSLLGSGGFMSPAALALLADIRLGTPPHALGNALAPPQLAADGTTAAAEVDAARIRLLPATGLTAADIALGHMEASVSVPAGGIKCSIPVSKTADPDPVNVGSDFQYHINIPSDAAFFNSLFNCDLTGISAVDTVETQSGNPTIQLISADHGGKIAGNKVTWPDLGSYALGDPPIVLTIVARVPAGSGAGVLRDTVNVNAALGNCRGGATGEDIVQGNANLNQSAVSGTFSLIAPNVTRGTLASTGGNSWPLVAGGGFMLAALGLVRLRRRATEASPR